MAAQTIKVDADELTLGQIEFLNDFTGFTVNEIQEHLLSGEFMAKELIAMVALDINPDDPTSALTEARNTKIADLAAGTSALD